MTSIFSYRRAGHADQLHREAEHQPPYGVEPEDGEGAPHLQLCQHPGVLPQELRQPLVRRAAHPPGMHEATPALHQLSHQVGRHRGRRGRRVRRPFLSPSRV